MDVQPDFRDLLALFNAHRAEYVVVGAYALAFHGAPRFTGDMDILVRPGVRNARRVIAALAEFGFASLGLTAEDFKQSGRAAEVQELSASARAIREKHTQPQAQTRT